MQSFRPSLLPRAGAATASLRRAFSSTRPSALAKMQILGRLADAPQMAPTSTGREITKFAVGVSSGPRDEQGNRAVSWYRVASFAEGPQREILLGMEKGQQIYVEADARMDTYEAEDPNDRNKRVVRTQLNLLMRNFEALGRPQRSNTHNTEPQHVGDEGAGAVASA